MRAKRFSLGWEDLIYEVLLDSDNTRKQICSPYRNDALFFSSSKVYREVRRQ
ncbi:MAG TPA: hypothetical protein VF845_05815 [Terriglobales bacterium]